MTWPARALALLLAVWIALPAQAQPQRGEPLPRKGALGAQLAPATADEAKAAGLEAGINIAGVLPGLTAEKLKLQPQDILLNINGQAVKTTADLSGLLRTLNAGSQLSVEVMRAGQKVTLKAPLVEKPKQKGDGFKVVYDQVVSLGKRIRVIGTHPDRPGKQPTIFLIGGIGSYSLDGEYSAIGYGNVLGPLAKDYAIVRIDKPGHGDSEGPASYVDLTFDVELDAYVQAIRLAKTLPFADPNRIAIFGHSMGGCFGPLAASQEKVAGVAVNGTVARTWVEYNLDNMRRQSLLGGASPAALDEEMKQAFALNHYLFNEGLSYEEVIKQKPALAAFAREYSPDGRTISGVGIPFWQQLAKKNLMDAWAKTDAKVLAIYGENDFLTDVWDHRFIAESVNALRPGTAEYKVLANSDHGFKTTSSQKDSLTRWTQPGQFNPNIIETLKEWLGRIFPAA